MEKECRAAKAAETAAGLEEAFQTALIGTEQAVLFEQTEDGLFTGHAPNYVKVYAEGEDLNNEIRTVKITALWRDGVRGEIQ